MGKLGLWIPALDQLWCLCLTSGRSLTAGLGLLSVDMNIYNPELSQGINK